MNKRKENVPLTPLPIHISYPGLSTEDPEFPTDDALKQYWWHFYRILHDLRSLNPFDRYFQVEVMSRFYTHKNLFAMWLGELKRPTRVLEIGCRTGLSICAHMKFNPACTAVLIDPFTEMGSPDVVRGNLRSLHIPTDNVHFIVGYSKDVLPTLKEQFDYILVDGSHVPADVEFDLHEAERLLAPTGVMVFDDLSPTGSNLLPVWRKLRSDWEQREYMEPWEFAVAKNKVTRSYPLSPDFSPR